MTATGTTDSCRPPRSPSSRRLPVHTAVYLLLLRNPVTVARQLSLARAARTGSAGVRRRPGWRRSARARGLRRGRPDAWAADERLPRHRARAPCGRDRRPRRRGVVGARRTGDADSACAGADRGGGSQPTPPSSRAARLGDGWLGVFVAPERWNDVASPGRGLRARARPHRMWPWQHGLSVWVGFGDSRADAEPRLGAAMEGPLPPAVPRLRRVRAPRHARRRRRRSSVGTPTPAAARSI